MEFTRVPDSWLEDIFEKIDGTTRVDPMGANTAEAITGEASGVRGVWY